MEEEPVYEMKLTNGIGEQMLAHVIEQFDVELKQTEFGPRYKRRAWKSTRLHC